MIINKTNNTLEFLGISSPGLHKLRIFTAKFFILNITKQLKKIEINCEGTKKFVIFEHNYNSTFLCTFF